MFALHQAYECMFQEVPSDPRYKQIPPRYHSMHVLDDSSQEVVTGSFGFLTSLYKVVDSVDGRTYALRRVERVRTNNEVVVWEGMLSHLDARARQLEATHAPQHHLSARLLSQQWCRVLRSRLLSYCHQHL